MRIIGMSVVAEGEAGRYLKQALDKNTEICDEVVIWGDNTDRETIDLCNSYKNVTVYNSNKSQWGKKQWQIKETLFNNYIIPKKPDWILSFDADEVFDDTFTRDRAEELADTNEIAYEFYCVHLWDSEKTRRVDGLWGDFYNVRYWKYIEGATHSWKPTALHCGSAPVYAYNWRGQANHLFKHYGYMKKEDRDKKVARYAKFDPRAIYKSKDYYDSITSEPVLKEFNEAEFVKTIKLKYKNPKLSNIPMKEEFLTLVNNKTRKMFSMPKELAEEQIKRSPDLFTLTTDVPKIKAQIKEEPKIDVNRCHICGKTFKARIGLAGHMRSHK